MANGEQQVAPRLNDQYYTQVSESLKNVLELSTRIDERVQIHKEEIRRLKEELKLQQEALNQLGLKIQAVEEVKALKETIKGLEGIIRGLELKLQSIEEHSTRSENRWKIIVDYGVKIIWVIIMAYMLYRLGLQGPNTPP